MPETQFYREPSGLEKIEAAKAKGVEFPAAVRSFFEQLPSRTKAYFQADDLTIDFYGFDSEPLLRLHAEIRGSGNPAEALRRLCTPHDWIVVDDQSGDTIDLAATTLAGWNSFVSYRQQVVTEATDSVPGANAKADEPS